MKKKIVMILTCVTLTISCFGCGVSYEEVANTETKEDYGNGYFTEITEWNADTYHYHIVYANDTKVKYLIVSGSERYGITPLYNADGSLQIYE